MTVSNDCSQFQVQVNASECLNVDVSRKKSEREVKVAMNFPLVARAIDSTASSLRICNSANWDPVDT